MKVDWKPFFALAVILAAWLVSYWPLRTDVGGIPLFYDSFSYVHALDYEHSFYAAFLTLFSRKYLYVWLAPLIYLAVIGVLYGEKKEALYLAVYPLALLYNAPCHVAVFPFVFLVWLLYKKADTDAKVALTTLLSAYFFKEHALAGFLLTWGIAHSHKKDSRAFYLSSLVFLPVLFWRPVKAHFSFEFLKLFLEEAHLGLLTGSALAVLLALNLLAKEWRLLSAFFVSMLTAESGISQAFALFPIAGLHLVLLDLSLSKKQLAALCAASFCILGFSRLDQTYEMARLKAVHLAQLVEDKVYPLSFVPEMLYWSKKKTLYSINDKELLEPSRADISYLNYLMFVSSAIKEAEKLKTDPQELVSLRVSEAKKLASSLDVPLLDLFRSASYVKEMIDDDNESSGWIDFLYPPASISFLVSMDPTDSILQADRLGIHNFKLFKATNLKKTEDNSTLEAGSFKLDLKDFTYKTGKVSGSLSKVIVFDKGSLKLYLGKKAGDIAELVLDTSSCIVASEEASSSLLGIVHYKTLFVDPYSPVITVLNSRQTAILFRNLERLKKQRLSETKKE